MRLRQAGYYFAQNIFKFFFLEYKLEWAASNGNRYPPYPQVMATAISQ